ncbi:UDP-3-O-(3-hydroxymyristoyl)glucosamine N-acyltransferase [Rhodospirillaceae bacterium KN72]|uniref:UDP-3-O-acylglucosamine N-acyltransferase n=1 Tax=Pacificispira spongiicola TaxID=2729598 RepID=A0A7Y0DYW1_9PROT|nr:UDP-3-O-(3-hydroxymyristoyl)glucosamine N-acyltransferase [Pacificispira spongiicola]NMM44028.1 UDP-3-O-(3-hydroxymyristoyl)glucosamine N-acyltransferase [Pacificispira spongiicola]
MPDPRFFSKHGPFTLGELARNVGCQLSDPDASDRLIEGTAAIESADAASVSFLANRRYVKKLAQTTAAAVILEEKYVGMLPLGTVGVVSRRPYYDFALISQAFYPEPTPEPLIHPAASIHDSATIGENVRIDPGARVAEGAVISDGAWIGANAVIDTGVTVGAGTWIGPAAYVGYADIGDHCRIHSGVRIGTRGFGFAMDRDGYVDIPQLGAVKIGHFVEIGANSCVDRGMGPDTVIGDGCKIDNLVQIGHNVVLGKGCVIAGQAGVAGSTILGDFVVCGAQSGVAGHLTVGSGAQLAARCGVIQNVEPKAIMGGLPAVPVRQWLRQHAFLKKAMSRPEKN